MISEDRKSEIDERLMQIKAIWHKQAEEKRKGNEKQKSFQFPTLPNRKWPNRIGEYSGGVVQR